MEKIIYWFSGLNRDAATCGIRRALQGSEPKLTPEDLTHVLSQDTVGSGKESKNNREIQKQELEQSEGKSRPQDRNGK